jgi:aminomethyltransferase
MWTIYKKGVGDGRVRYIGQNALEKIVEENKLGKRRDRKRVGFILDGPGIVRENCRIFNEKGEEIGKTSSGVYSPVLKKGVGMAYVDQQYIKNGTKLLA